MGGQGSGMKPKRKVGDVLGNRAPTNPVVVLDAPDEKMPVASPAPEIVSSPSPAKSSDFPARENTSNRVAIAIDASGKIDFDSMREGTKVKVREALRNSVTDENFRRQLGLAAEAAQPQIITKEAMSGLLDVIARVEAGVYSKKTGLTYEEVLGIVQWDEKEHKILDAQACALANKYIPLSWLNYADVGVFAMTVFALMKAKAGMVEQYQRKMLDRMAGAPPPAPAPVPAPIPQATPIQSAGAVAPVPEPIPASDLSRSLENMPSNGPGVGGGNPLKSLEG